MSHAFRGALALTRGDPGENTVDWRAVVAHLPPMPLIQVTVPTQLALAGQFDEARAAFEPFRHIPGEFPYGVRWAPTLGTIGQCAVLLDDAEVAGACHDLLAGTAHYYSGDGSGGIFSNGSNAGPLGDFARVAGRVDQALAHYRDAVAMNVRIGARPFTALARLGWAQTLLTHHIDRAKAIALLIEAGAEFARLDMPGPLATATALNGQEDSPLSACERQVAAHVADGQPSHRAQVSAVRADRRDPRPQHPDQVGAALPHRDSHLGVAPRR